MNPTKCQWPSQRANEQVEVRATSCPLKVDEPQVGGEHEDVERKWNATTLWT